MLGDNLYGGERRQGLQEEVRGSVQADPRCEGQVLRDARQPRQPEPATLQAVQHERRAVLHVQAQGRRQVLRARQQLHGQGRSSPGWRKSSPRADRTGRLPSSIIRSTRQEGSTAPISSCAQLLEPIFLKYGVDAVFWPVTSISTNGSSRRRASTTSSRAARRSCATGDVGPRSELTAKGFDTGYHFMLMELGKDALHFQAISDQGKTVDSGTLPRLNDQDKKKMAGL